MPRYHDSGKLRGYALLDFSTPAQAAAACKRSGVMLQGRYLDVTVSTGRDAGRAPPRTLRVASSCGRQPRGH